MGSSEFNALLGLALMMLAGDGQAANIACFGNKTLEAALASVHIMNFDKVAIHRCPAPAVSYATVFASRFNITAIKQITLDDMPAEPPLQRTHFTGLGLSALSITYAYSELRNRVTLDTSFLDTSATVILKNVNLPPLPKTARTKKVELWNGQSLGEWGGCFDLLELELNMWDVKHVPERWLAHCSNLTTLLFWTIYQLTSQALGRALDGATSLRELKISYCELEEVNLQLADMMNLQRLDLSWNSLRNIFALALPASLTSLDLTGNQLWSIAAEVLQQLPVLQNLSVDWNPKLDLCQESAQVDARTRRPTLKRLVLPSIKRLSAAWTATRHLCFGAMQTDSLTRLDLTHSKITALKFRDLPVSKASLLELTMNSNPVREVVLEQEDYEMLRDRRVAVVGISVTTLECDCQYGWLNRAMREGRLSIEYTQCSDGTQLASVPPERVQCDRFSCSESACTCRRAWRDNTIVARCTAAGNLSAVPRIPGLRALHAAGNRVRTFSADDLPDSLLLLDLTGNSVSRADAAAAAALFARPERRVRIARNPLLCICENGALVTALQEHRAQVVDYDDVTCFKEDGREVALHAVKTVELCTDQRERQSWLTLALAGGAALVGLAALAAALHYRYGRLVAVYIFTHGWCLNCVREEELDADRPFDAFVSFAHADYEFVTEHLLPGLESEPHKYRLCVHTRDWVPGEMIPAQIARSVRLSRRTIIVLSRNFLQSVSRTRQRTLPRVTGTWVQSVR